MSHLFAWSGKDKISTLGKLRTCWKKVFEKSLSSQFECKYCYLRAYRIVSASEHETASFWALLSCLFFTVWAVEDNNPCKHPKLGKCDIELEAAITVVSDILRTFVSERLQMTNVSWRSRSNRPT